MTSTVKKSAAGRTHKLLKSKILLSYKCLAEKKNKQRTLRSKSMLHPKLTFQTSSRWYSNVPIKAHMEERPLNQGV